MRKLLLVLSLLASSALAQEGFFLPDGGVAWVEHGDTIIQQGIPEPDWKPTPADLERVKTAPARIKAAEESLRSAWESEYGKNPAPVPATVVELADVTASDQDDAGTFATALIVLIVFGALCLLVPLGKQPVPTPRIIPRAPVTPPPAIHVASKPRTRTRVVYRCPLDRH